MRNTNILGIVFGIFSIAAIGSCRNKTIDPTPAKIIVSSLDSCNYVFNEGFKFREGRWVEQRTQRRIDAGDPPDHIIFVSDSLMIDSGLTYYTYFKTRFYKCSGMQISPIDSVANPYGIWLDGVLLYNDTTQTLTHIRYFYTQIDTTSYKRE